MTTVFRAGNVTLQLDEGLERFVRGMLERAETESLQAARSIGEEVAEEARRGWYGEDGVTRRTGKSGDIRVVESLDVQSGEVRVSVGSADPRRSRGRPVPEFIRRPGRLSMVKREVSRAEYWRTPRALRANYRPIPGRDPDGSRGPFVFEPNPKAGDGRKMLMEFIKKPVRKRMRKAARALAKAIVEGG